MLKSCAILEFIVLLSANCQLRTKKLNFVVVFVLYPYQKLTSFRCSYVRSGHRDYSYHTEIIHITIIHHTYTARPHHVGWRETKVQFGVVLVKWSHPNNGFLRRNNSCKSSMSHGYMCSKHLHVPWSFCDTITHFYLAVHVKSVTVGCICKHAMHDRTCMASKELKHISPSDGKD